MDGIALMALKELGISGTNVYVHWWYTHENIFDDLPMLHAHHQMIRERVVAHQNHDGYALDDVIVMDFRATYLRKVYERNAVKGLFEEPDWEARKNIAMSVGVLLLH